MANKVKVKPVRTPGQADLDNVVLRLPEAQRIACAGAIERLDGQLDGSAQLALTELRDTLDAAGRDAGQAVHVAKNLRARLETAGAALRDAIATLDGLDVADLADAAATRAQLAQLRRHVGDAAQLLVSD